MSPRPLRLFAQAALATAIILPLAACSAKPENSPVIRKKLAEVDEMKDQLEQTVQLVRSMSGDITIMKDEISNLRAFTPDGDDVSTVVNRLERMENRLAEVEVSATTMASASQSRSSSSASAPAAAERESAPTATTRSSSSQPRLAGTSESAPAERETASATPVADPNRASGTARAASTSSSSTPRQTAATTSSSSTPRQDVRPVASGNRNQASTPSVPRGRYYRIESGDTLEKIAADNNLTVAELREANRLPAGARPLPGQSLFIPAKN